MGGSEGWGWGWGWGRWGNYLGVGYEWLRKARGPEEVGGVCVCVCFGWTAGSWPSHLHTILFFGVLGVGLLD